VEVLLSEHGAVARLTLNRPARLNALSTSLLFAIDRALDEVLEKRHLRALVLAGSGKVFCAGADIDELRSKETALQAGAYIEQIQRVFSRLEALPIPTVAAVHGAALGGGFEMALAADLIVAEESARFGLPEVNLGVIPGAGGTQRLPRLIGRNRAKELLMTGEPIPARKACEWGIVNRVVPAGEALAAATALAEQLAAKAPAAIKMAKQVVNCGAETDLQSGLVMEAQAITILFGTRDQKEGMSAFLEKRAARFTGE